MVVQLGRIGHGNDIVSGIRLAAIGSVAFGWLATFGSLHSAPHSGLRNVHNVHGASSSSLTPLYLLHVKMDGTYGRATMDSGEIK